MLRSTSVPPEAILHAVLRDWPGPAGAGVTVVSIVKNELFFLPAFIEHYRELGVARFIFLDDHSSDGTREYIAAQSDCGLLGSELTFSQLVDGKKAHELWRSEIPRHYCDDQWTLVVDVDEFLHLPPPIRDLQSFVSALDDRGERVVGAVMVDFYPSSIGGLEDGNPPASKAELFERYPYFDACVHGHWLPEENKFHRLYGGAEPSDAIVRRRNQEVAVDSPKNSGS